MGSSAAGSLAPSPFKLPASYEEAKERKVAAVSDLRNAVKAVSLTLHDCSQYGTSLGATGSHVHCAQSKIYEFAVAVC